MNINTFEFEMIHTIPLSSKRSIVISRNNAGYLWINEKIDSEEYSGFTHKGFGLREMDLATFIDKVRAVAVSARPKEYHFELGPGKELVVYRPENNQVDIRQSIRSEKYTGFTRRGLRLVSANAIKLTDGLEQVIGDTTQSRGSANTKWAQYDSECKMCGTTKRPHFEDGLCQACYEREHNGPIAAEEQLHLSSNLARPQVDSTMMDDIYKIHGRRCYVCNMPGSRFVSLSPFFADGDTSNTTENNMYPICSRCKQVI